MSQLNGDEQDQSNVTYEDEKKRVESVTGGMQLGIKYKPTRIKNAQSEINNQLDVSQNESDKRLIKLDTKGFSSSIYSDPESRN